MWVRVKVLVEAEERPRRLEAVARHFQLAFGVHVLHQKLERNRDILFYPNRRFCFKIGYKEARQHGIKDSSGMVEATCM